MEDLGLFIIGILLLTVVGFIIFVTPEDYE